MRELKAESHEHKSIVCHWLCVDKHICEATAAACLKSGAVRGAAGEGTCHGDCDAGAISVWCRGAPLSMFSGGRALYRSRVSRLASRAGAGGRVFRSSRRHRHCALPPAAPARAAPLWHRASALAAVAAPYAHQLSKPERHFVTQCAFTPNDNQLNTQQLPFKNPIRLS